ncbi:MAG: hypothetical protein OHK0017_01710 [Patescibacteria group bacterium]
MYSPNISFTNDRLSDDERDRRAELERQKNQPKEPGFLKKTFSFLAEKVNNYVQTFGKNKNPEVLEDEDDIVDDDDADQETEGKPLINLDGIKRNVRQTWEKVSKKTEKYFTKLNFKFNKEDKKAEQTIWADERKALEAKYKAENNLADPNIKSTPEFNLEALGYLRDLVSKAGENIGENAIIKVKFWRKWDQLRNILSSSTDLTVGDVYELIGVFVQELEKLNTPVETIETRLKDGSFTEYDEIKYSKPKFGEKFNVDTTLEEVKTSLDYVSKLRQDFNLTDAELKTNAGRRLREMEETRARQLALAVAGTLVNTVSLGVTIPVHLAVSTAYNINAAAKQTASEAGEIVDFKETREIVQKLSEINSYLEQFTLIDESEAAKLVDLKQEVKMILPRITRTEERAVIVDVLCKIEELSDFVFPGQAKLDAEKLTLFPNKAAEPTASPEVEKAKKKISWYKKALNKINQMLPGATEHVKQAIDTTKKTVAVLIDVNTTGDQRIDEAKRKLQVKSALIFFGKAAVLTGATHMASEYLADKLDGIIHHGASVDGIVEVPHNIPNQSVPSTGHSPEAIVPTPHASPEPSILPTPEPSPIPAPTPTPEALVDTAHNAPVDGIVNVPHNIGDNWMDGFKSFFGIHKVNLPANSYLAETVQQGIDRHDDAEHVIRDWLIQNYRGNPMGASEAFAKIQASGVFEGKSAEDLLNLDFKEIDTLADSLGPKGSKMFVDAFANQAAFIEAVQAAGKDPGFVEAIANRAEKSNTLLYAIAGILGFDFANKQIIKNLKSKDTLSPSQQKLKKVLEVADKGLAVGGGLAVGAATGGAGMVIAPISATIVSNTPKIATDSVKYVKENGVSNIVPDAVAAVKETSQSVGNKVNETVDALKNSKIGTKTAELTERISSTTKKSLDSLKQKFSKNSEEVKYPENLTEAYAVIEVIVFNMTNAVFENLLNGKDFKLVEVTKTLFNSFGNTFPEVQLLALGKIIRNVKNQLALYQPVNVNLGDSGWGNARENSVATILDFNIINAVLNTKLLIDSKDTTPSETIVRKMPLQDGVSVKESGITPDKDFTKSDYFKNLEMIGSWTILAPSEETIQDFKLALEAKKAKQEEERLDNLFDEYLSKQEQYNNSLYLYIRNTFDELKNTASSTPLTDIQKTELLWQKLVKPLSELRKPEFIALLSFIANSPEFTSEYISNDNSIDPNAANYKDLIRDKILELINGPLDQKFAKVVSTASRKMADMLEAGNQERDVKIKQIKDSAQNLANLDIPNQNRTTYKFSLVLKKFYDVASAEQQGLAVDQDSIQTVNNYTSFIERNFKVSKDQSKIKIVTVYLIASGIQNTDEFPNSELDEVQSIIDEVLGYANKAIEVQKSKQSSAAA